MSRRVGRLVGEDLDLSTRNPRCNRHGSLTTDPWDERNGIFTDPWMVVFLW